MTDVWFYTIIVMLIITIAFLINLLTKFENVTVDVNNTSIKIKKTFC